MKKTSLLFGALAVVGLGLTSCSSAALEAPSADLPISSVHGTFSVDMDNPRAVVGDADYVFVGKVDSFTGTEYKFPVTVENEDGSEKEVGSPYSNFKVIVSENLKGDLLTNQPIALQKWGGIAEDKKTVVLYEDDLLPEVGQSYVFAAYAQPDGSLLVSGPNSNVAIDAGNAALSKSSVTNSKTVQEYADAVNRQEKSKRERFVSKFEADS